MSRAASIAFSTSRRPDDISPRTTLMQVSKALGSHNQIPLGPLSMDMEIYIPPEQRETSTNGTSPSYEEEIIDSYNFF